MAEEVGPPPVTAEYGLPDPAKVRVYRAALQARLSEHGAMVATVQGLAAHGVETLPGVRGRQAWQGEPANTSPDALPSAP